MEILKFTEKSLLFQLLRGADTLKRDVGEALESTQLNFNQALLLIILHSERKKEITPTVLVELLDLPKSVVSQLVSSLEEQKLIKRTVNIKDARKFNLDLSAKGKQKAHQAIKLIDALDKDLEKGFSKSELNNFLKFVKKVR